MAKYRKKPVVVDAWKFPDEVQHIPSDIEFIDIGSAVAIKTLEGEMLVVEGSYIIRGVKGEYYPCDPEIFEMTYEEVTDDE